MLPCRRQRCTVALYPGLRPLFGTPLRSRRPATHARGTAISIISRVDSRTPSITVPYFFPHTQSSLSLYLYLSFKQNPKTQGLERMSSATAEESKSVSAHGHGGNAGGTDSKKRTRRTRSTIARQGRATGGGERHRWVSHLWGRGDDDSESESEDGADGDGVSEDDGDSEGASELERRRRAIESEKLESAARARSRKLRRSAARSTMDELRSLITLKPKAKLPTPLPALPPWLDSSSNLVLDSVLLRPFPAAAATAATTTTATRTVVTVGPSALSGMPTAPGSQQRQPPTVAVARSVVVSTLGGTREVFGRDRGVDRAAPRSSGCGRSQTHGATERRRNKKKTLRAAFWVSLFVASLFFFRSKTELHSAKVKKKSAGAHSHRAL